MTKTRQHQPKRIADALAKLNWGERAHAVLALCALTAILLPAQTLTTLHNFNATDGANPRGALVQATDGSFYGTTASGGTSNNGTVFKITPSGTVTPLYSFCPQSKCMDGGDPWDGLVQATNGDFYGTASYGANYRCGIGCGTVFKITPGGALKTLYRFSGSDGGIPHTGLAQAANGDFYGTTSGGNGYDNYGAATIFKITPRGTLTTLYSFGGFTLAPSQLLLATNGNFYGTTYGDGTNFHGTIFKITPGGKLTTLYNFCSQSNCTDGYSASPLVQATNGNFYGTTASGGASAACDQGCGTVFKINPNGTLTTLHSFCAESGCTDGSVPVGALEQATDGNLYGTTSGYGTSGKGTIFKITPSGTLTTLYRFCAQSGCPDGYQPFAALVQGTDGKLYGTTELGGANCAPYGCGTAFSLSVGLSPFAELLPRFGKVGSAVEILGTGLIGTTSVRFNGTPALFTVVSDTEITTTVPVGATTGKVQVATPGGTLLSGGPFRVQ